MGESTAFISPEFALVAALEGVGVLAGRVAAMQPPAKASPPFAFYIPSGDSEDQDLDGPTGLKHFSASVHLVAGSARYLQSLSAHARAAVCAMQGNVYTLEAGSDPAGMEGGGRVLIEHADAIQSSPDLFESKVGLYRRVYTVSLDYQAEETEVLSG